MSTPPGTFAPANPEEPSDSHATPDETSEQGVPAEKENPPEGGKKSTATVLVELAQELYEFGLSDTGEVYALPVQGPRVVRMLRGGKTSLRAQLAHEYFQRHHKAASQQALADAVAVLEGRAQNQPEHELHLRVADDHRGTHWLDLGDAHGRAVRLSPQGWAVHSAPPVLFKRTALTTPLPQPETGGDLGQLWHWLNVTEADRPLVLAWLVAALHPRIPHPVLGLFGEQGTGKTTAEKLLVSLVDPSPVPTRKSPRDADTWVTAAAGSWIVGLDNLSDIPACLSDSLCRAVTGEGDARRRLYTDGDISVISFRRCLVLTGIDVGALSGDLAERLMHINLEPISTHTRRDEHALWAAWDRLHPRLLGALLDLAVEVERVLPGVQLEATPRMADFARVLAAVDAVLGTDGFTRYHDKQTVLAADTLTGDPFISRLVETISTTTTATSRQLLDLVASAPGHGGAMQDLAGSTSRGWPKDARTVTQRLRKFAPAMRHAGWTVTEQSRTGRQHALHWHLTPPTRESGYEAPQRPQRPHTDGVRSAHDYTDAGGTAGASGPIARSARTAPATARANTPDVNCENIPDAGDAGDAGALTGLSLSGGGTDCQPPEQDDRGATAEAVFALTRELGARPIDPNETDQ